MPALSATPRLVILLLVVLLLVAAPALALEVPSAPQGRVSDYAGVLTVEQRRDLEGKLARFEEETSNQVAVVIITTLAGDSLEDYSIRLAEKWRIGRKGKDNGVILLIVTQDRKIRIEVGYGLEGLLPDSVAGEIIRQEIASRFRQGEFYQGIQAGVDAIMAATKGEYRPAPPTGRGGGSLSWVWIILFVLFVLSATAGNFRRRPPYSRRGGRFVTGGPFWWGGGFGGGGFSGGGFGGGFSGGGGGFGGGGASGGW
ncbi:MAG TPA: TPM domain-containing protein [Syntrophobacteria bacterium]|nr:TPM domain-containing protein [Syntrophobacteria bacterium]